MNKLIKVLQLALMLIISSLSSAETPSITVKILSYQQGAEHCQLTYSVSNNSWGTMKELWILTEAFDDRGTKMKGYKFNGEYMNPFGGWSWENPVISIPKGGISKMNDLKFKGMCQYIGTINVLEVKDKNCIIRMMPEEAICPDVMVYKSNIEHITFQKK
jgi:hypothetical protein